MLTQEPDFCLRFTDTWGTFRSHWSSNAERTETIGTHLELGSEKGDLSLLRLSHNCGDLFLLSKPKQEKLPAVPLNLSMFLSRIRIWLSFSSLSFKKINGLFSCTSLTLVIGNSCKYAFCMCRFLLWNPDQCARELRGQYSRRAPRRDIRFPMSTTGCRGARKQKPDSYGLCGHHRKHLQHLQNALTKCGDPHRGSQLGWG